MSKPMNQITSAIKRVAFGSVAVLFVAFMPASYVFAESVDAATPSASSSCTPVAAAPNGVSRPTGASAGTYKYNPCTGLWENVYYTWSPVTKTATPKTPYVYSCDTTAWQWTTQQWVYSPSTGTFIQVPLSVAQLPDGAAVASGSPAVCAPAPAATTSSPNPASNSTTDPSSNNGTVNSVNNNSAALNSNSAATMNNQLGSSAVSGSALVASNTTAGNAATGNATAEANVVNSVQSSSALTGTGGSVVTFVANINGDVQGDLVVDPGQLQPAGDSQALSANNLTVNTQTTGRINNNITLNAASGNAAVTDNTKAGNATTGNAAAVADVVNMLNTIVSAGQSFMGVININGNMHGNILVPQKFLDSLIASNAPSTTVELSTSSASNLGIASTTNQAITNNVTSQASTGGATVADNTSAGSATTGNASTKVTIFNLTGSQIVGANCLLVFVNVSGTWVGVIMNAPAGTTAAALGSGTPADTLNNALVNATATNAITNNINVGAQSGSATVAHNSQAGDALSGNADTAVNLLNLNNAQFSLTGWFGVLFINIFGDWFGSFGVYTPPASTGTTGFGGGSKPGQGAAGNNPADRRVFQFAHPLQTANLLAASGATGHAPLSTFSAQLASEAGQVLGAGIGNINHNVTGISSPRSDSAAHLKVAGGALMALGLSVLAAERVTNGRRTRRSL